MERLVVAGIDGVTRNILCFKSICLSNLRLSTDLKIKVNKSWGIFVILHHVNSFHPEARRTVFLGTLSVPRKNCWARPYNSEWSLLQSSFKILLKLQNWIKWYKQTTFTFWLENMGSVWNELNSEKLDKDWCDFLAFTMNNCDYWI